MRLYMPVDVREETEAVRNHPEIFEKEGRHALIVTGKHSSRANGSLQDVLDTLEKCGITACVFDSVAENPSVDTVMEAASFGRKEGADFIVGIGGGSPMDAAKAAALMMAHPDRDAAYLYEKNQDSSHLPVILVPTTCGTGSEVTPVSVLTKSVGSQKVKSSIPYKIFADSALIDGKYLSFASSGLFRNTVIDALGHLWESALNRDASPYSLMFAGEGLRIWRENRDLITKDPASLTEDEGLRLMHASALAGMAIAHTGTSLPHALSYTITTDAGVPHGRAIGYFEAGYLAKAGERGKHLLEAAGFSSARSYEDFYEEACGGEEFPAALLEKAVDAVLANPAKIRKAPYKADRDVLMDIAFRRI